MKSSRRYAKLLAIAILLFFFAHQGIAQQRVVKPDPLLPEELIDLLINEVSGDIPFQNEILLAGVNRTAPPRSMRAPSTKPTSSSRSSRNTASRKPPLRSSLASSGQSTGTPKVPSCGW